MFCTWITCLGVVVLIVMVAFVLVKVYDKNEGYGWCGRNYEISMTKALKNTVKVINVIENHGFPKGPGWIVDDGYPAPTMLQFMKDPPDWIKPLKPYDRVFISTEKPGGQFISATVDYADKAQIGWTTIGSGDSGEDALEKCCVKDGKVDMEAFYKNYGNRTMFEEGYTYSLMADDKSAFAMFWLGMDKSSAQPYPVGTKMYIFGN